MGPAAPAPALLEAAQVVWPGSGRVQVARWGRAPQGAEDFLVLPGLGSPRWLLPLGGAATASALVGTASGPVRRSVVAGIGLAQQTGVVERLPLRRLRVSDSRGRSLVSLVEETVGHDVEVAIRIAAWDHARGLVVRAFAPDGTTTAFARVGIDEHGLSAVRAELHALSRVTELRLRQVVPPTVVGVPRWRGHDVLVVSPLLAGQPVRATSPMPLDAMRELAGAGAARVGALSTSAWWASVSERLETVLEPGLRHRLDAARQALGRVAARVDLSLGPWHGDWTPWNMSWDAGRVLLWDWEHFAEDVPAGFDAAHYLAQLLRTTEGTDRAAEQSWRARLTRVLDERFGLGPGASEVVALAYLLEVNLRFVLDRQGTSAAATARTGWGMELLEDHAQGRAG